MEALKDQMASMMEAMLSMKRMMESNATTIVTAEADPTHPSAINQAHQPISDMVRQGGEVLAASTIHTWGIIGTLTPMAYPPIIRRPP